MALRMFKQDILDALKGEPIEAIRIDETDILDFSNKAADDKVPKDLLGKVISWDIAAPLLDYPYDSDFGSQECHDVMIWTATRVWFIHEYDGTTWFTYVYRNPTNKED